MDNNKSSGFILWYSSFLGIQDGGQDGREGRQWKGEGGCSLPTPPLTSLPNLQIRVWISPGSGMPATCHLHCHAMPCTHTHYHHLPATCHHALPWHLPAIALHTPSCHPLGLGTGKQIGKREKQSIPNIIFIFIDISSLPFQDYSGVGEVGGGHAHTHIKRHSITYIHKIHI